MLDLTLGNFAEIGLTEVAIVVGYRKEAVYERKAALEAEVRPQAHPHRQRQGRGVEQRLLPVVRAVTSIKHSVILANGDTVHPVSVEKTLLAARGDGQKIILALDTVKKLADEEMKVVVDPDKGVQQITKLMDPAEATGEYIGVTLIEGEAADELADALKTTFERDPDLYYEDGYQELVNRGFKIDVAPIGDVTWVEIDNHDDLAKGREIACQY